jgi:hypothetical protein
MSADERQDQKQTQVQNPAFCLDQRLSAFICGWYLSSRH